MNKFLGVLGVFSGFSETRRGKNKNLFYFRGFRGLLSSSFVVAVVVSTGAGLQASGPEGGWLWSSGRVFPAFCPACCFVLVVLLANMALFRILRGFLEGFGVVVCVCIACVLCVACGAFVCVWS